MEDNEMPVAPKIEDYLIFSLEDATIEDTTPTNSKLNFLICFS
jgi:hypothetical protein